MTYDVNSCAQEDILSIWNKTASDQVTTSRIRDTLRRVLNLPPNTIMEYKTHNDSLKYVQLILHLLKPSARSVLKMIACRTTPIGFSSKTYAKPLRSSVLLVRLSVVPNLVHKVL